MSESQQQTHSLVFYTVTPEHLQSIIVSMPFQSMLYVFKIVYSHSVSFALEYCSNSFGAGFVQRKSVVMY